MGHKGKNKATARPMDEMIETVREEILRRNPALASIRDSEIEFCLNFGKSLYVRDAEQKSPITTTRQILQQLKDDRRESMSVLIPKTPNKNESVNKGKKKQDVNWGIYQRMGGDPKIHELMPLDNVEFKPVEMEWAVREGDQNDGGVPVSHDVNENVESPDPRRDDLVKYQPVDANLVDMLMENQYIIKHGATRHNHELAIGFDESDDARFLNGTLTPPPRNLASADVSPLAAPPSSTETFPEFDPNYHYQTSPLHMYGLHVDRLNQTSSMPRQDSPLQRQPRLGANFGDILSRANNAAASATGMYETQAFDGNNPYYSYTGQPVNNQQPGGTEFFNRTQSPQVPTGPRTHPALRTQSPQVPTGPRSRLPTRYSHNRTPSPAKNQFVPASSSMAANNTHMNNARQGGSSLPYQSFTAFNQAAHEMHSQTYTQGFYNITSPTRTQAAPAVPPGFYATSPTKTQAQMSRAFNSPAVNYSQTPQSTVDRLNASAPAYQHGGQAGQAQAQTQNHGSKITTYNLQGLAQSNQFPPLPSTSSSSTPATGAMAYYNGVTSTPSPSNSNSFNIGAGTSRGWNPTGQLSTPRNLRPTGGVGGGFRRIAPGATPGGGQQTQSALRADSPSFVAGGRGRSFSQYLRGVQGVVTVVANGGNGGEESGKHQQQQNVPGRQGHYGGGAQ